MTTISSLTIMFSDIAGSTRLYEKLGDEEARGITSRCLLLLSFITEQHGGRVIKTIGDEVMCVFPDANRATRAAIEMQERVSARAQDTGAPLSIRVGYHCGPVIEEEGDVFGDAVNVAARMAGQAKGEQILTTGETVAHLDRALTSKTRLLITTTVKGKEKPLQIHEVTWGKEEDLTAMGLPLDPALLMRAQASSLVAAHGDTECTVDAKHKSITMGRGDKNDFVIIHDMVSRVHAKLEWRRGKLVFIDQSTNGSYVVDHAGVQKFVHRDELILQKTGTIGLGKPPATDPEHALTFTVK